MRKVFAAAAGVGAAALGLVLGIGACGGTGSAYAQGEASWTAYHNSHPNDISRALTQQILDETAIQHVPASLPASSGHLDCGL